MPAPTIVQSGSIAAFIPSSGPHTVSVNLPFAAPVTAGNTIIVCYGSRADGLGNVGSPTASDSLGNTYSVVTHVDAGTQIQGLAFLCSRNVLGGANTLTFSATASFAVGGTAVFAVAYAEVAGLTSSAAIQGSAIQQNGVGGGVMNLTITDSHGTPVTSHFDSPAIMNQQSGAVMDISGGGNDFFVACMSGSYAPSSSFGPTITSPSGYLSYNLLEDPVASNEQYYLAFWTPTSVLSISCGSPPGAILGSPYSHLFPTHGGTDPLTFDITSGSLPPGLVLDISTGSVSGIPTATGVSSFTIRVTDSLGETASKACSISVAAGGAWIIQEITAELIPCDPEIPGFGHFRYTVRCVDAAQAGTYLGFWDSFGGGSGDGGGGGSGSASGTSLPPAPPGQPPGGATVVKVALSGTVVGSEPEINFIPSTHIGINVTDDPTNSKVDVEITESGLAVSPLTTKGDVWGYDTTDARIPVGSDGQVLTADSTQALGVKWSAAAAGSGGVNAQTTNYTAVSGDLGKLITFASGSAVTLTLPSAAPSATWFIAVENTGAGLLTIDRNGHSIDGAAANLSLGTNQGLIVYTDGTNWFTMRGEALLLQTNGTDNGSQAKLNLVAGTNTTITDDGSGDVTITAGSGPSGRYDVAIELIGMPSGGSVDIGLFTFTEDVNFGSNWAGSVGKVGTAPTSTITWTLNKNGSSVGSIGISTGGVVSFTSSGAVSFTSGDFLTLVGSASADATLQDVSITLAGLRVSVGSDPIGVIPSQYVGGPIPASQIICLYTFPDAITFPANWSGSAGNCGTNPTSSAVFDVKKNGSSVGSVTISTAGVFTFATTGGLDVPFVSGDEMAVTAPSSSDATLADVAFSLSGNASGYVRLGRDLGGTTTAPLVIGFQGRDVAATAPSDGDVYTWVAANSDWEPQAPASGGGTVTHTGGALTADLPVFGAGAGDIKVGTKTGNTDEVVTATGAATAGRPLLYDASGNAVAGSVQGNTTTVQMASGTATNGYPLLYDSSGNAVARQPRGNTTVVQLADSTTNPTTGNLASFDANGNVKDSGISALTSSSAPVYYPPGGITLPPSVSTFTWVNQGTSTGADTSGGLFLSQPATSSNYIAALVKSAPATPYTLTVGFIPVFVNITYMGLGICLTDGTKIVAFTANRQSTPVFGLDKWNSYASYNSAYTTVGIPDLAVWPHMIWLRITDNGTNRISSWSVDGFNFFTLHTVARTDFLTATNIGIMVTAQNATYAATMSVFHWIIT